MKLILLIPFLLLLFFPSVNALSLSGSLAYQAKITAYNNGTSLVNSSSQTNSSGYYSLSLKEGIYDIKYELLNFSIPNFFVKLYSVNVSNDLIDLVKVSPIANKIILSVNLNKSIDLEVYSEKEPSRIAIGNYTLSKVSSISELSEGKWFYNSTTRILRIKHKSEGIRVGFLRLGVSVPSSVVRGFGAKHNVSIDLNYHGGRKFYDYMTKGPGFFSYIEFAMGLYDFWAGPGDREFLRGILDKAEEEGGKVEISIKLYGLDLGWGGWEPYLYLLLESIGPNRSSLRYIFLAGEWSYKSKVPSGWDDLYLDFQKAKQIVNSYGYELGWCGEGKYLSNIPKEYYTNFYALGPRERTQQVSRDPNCTKGAQITYSGANWWERPNDIFLHAFTMWDREANIPNTPPYYICYDKFKEFVRGAVDRFNASGGAYPKAICFEIMPETFNDVEGVNCPYLDWWREFAETYNLMIYNNAVKVREASRLQPPSPFPPYPVGLKYQNNGENLPPHSVQSGGEFRGSVIARNEYTRMALKNTEIEIYLIKRTPKIGASPWQAEPITKEQFNNMTLVGKVKTGSDGWAKNFTLIANVEPGFYTVIARVPQSELEMEAFSDVLEGIWVVNRNHRVEVRSNVKARLNHGPSAYGPPWQGCDPEGWIEPNKPMIGYCSEEEWKFIMPQNVTDSLGKTWIFSHWEDGSTNSTRIVFVDKDMNLTATYVQT